MTAATSTLEQHPNLELWGSYQLAFEHFNERLFDKQLPECILTFGCRGACNGIFKAKAWSREGNTLRQQKMFHEISLNPKLLKQTNDQIFQTLARQMVHLWQQIYGTPPGLSDYCNMEFTGKMAQVGLPCEKMYGRRLLHTVAEGGKYANACPEAMQHFFPLKGLIESTKQPPTKLKYFCPSCGFNFLAQGGGKVTCHTYDCNVPMSIQKPDE
ncbi:hypothetical protein HW132_32170 [Brasilonema sp. CT11]|nr:hypothetical protein [Brasilonema sp. CT11]